MKHAITSTLLAISISAGAQIHLPLKDFQDQSVTSGGWTTQILAGTNDWTTSDQGSTGDFYGKFSNYNGSGNDTAFVWLISPSIDLSSASTPILKFETACNYNGMDLELMVSSNYDGVSAPSSAIWTSISSMATLSPGGWNWTASGDIDLSAYNGSSDVYVAFVYEGGPVTLGKTWEVDKIIIDETATAPPTFVRIYDIQYTTTGDSPYKDSTVSTAGIVTAVASNGYYLQDSSSAWNGIFVFDPSNAVSMGDSLELIGDVDEYYDATQLENIVSFNIVSSGNALPAPLVLQSNDLANEMYESVLVRVENAECTATQGNGIWSLNDGSGVGLVQSGTTNGLFSFIPAVGSVYWVTGPLNYSFSEYKIWPRNAQDIVNTTNVLEQTAELHFSYNAMDETLIALAPVSGAEISVFTTSGKLVFTDSVYGQDVINIADLPSGMYLVTLLSNNKKYAKQIVKP